MRTIQSASLPRFLGQSPPAARSAREKMVLRASLELRLITPLLGGGVESFEPDVVDIVRIPTVRGHLRWWWRALYAANGEAADALFRREASLWGGLSVPDTGHKGEDQTLASRVRLTVEILDAGKVLPAGHHEPTDRGGVKAIPRWAIGSRLGYALFPLQRSQSERAERRDSGAMPTKAVRIDLRFRLHLAVTQPLEPAEDGAADAEQALAALWAWTSFGGLGARTRRGFGVLEPSSPIIEGLPDGRDAAWKGLFAAPQGNGIDGWLGELVRLAKPARGSFLSGHLLVGAKAQPRPSEAHEAMIDFLKAFRQGVDVGRDSGDRRPGRSRWPEANLLRGLWKAEHPEARFEHEPPRQGPAPEGAPRAAFGLPIQVKFKDPGDDLADATLLPQAQDGTADEKDPRRWSSPLLLRPLAVQEGYLPAAFVLGGDRPSFVRVVFDMEKGEKGRSVPVESASGAKPPISTHLESAGGDALKAFDAWLRKEHGFKEILLPAGEGEGHG